MTAPERASTGQPIGPVVGTGPARRPESVVLEGHFGRVEKLAAIHAPDLWEAVKRHDEIWTYMSSYGPFANPAEFADWVADRAKLDDPFSYAVVNSSGRVLGIATLMEIRPAMRVIEVGHIVYSPDLQRTPLATEAQYLLARYAFERLGYRRYEWKCNALNAASRRAALRFGFTFEGIMRQHKIAKGRNRDTAFFSLLDHEWPSARSAFEQWLEPGNFDGKGRQRRTLEEIRNAL
jgi:RimJ/RimL family protein N-acetyltransferase